MVVVSISLLAFLSAIPSDLCLGVVSRLLVIVLGFAQKCFPFSYFKDLGMF